MQGYFTASFVVQARIFELFQSKKESCRKEQNIFCLLYDHHSHHHQSRPIFSENSKGEWWQQATALMLQETSTDLLFLWFSREWLALLPKKCTNDSRIHLLTFVSPTGTCDKGFSYADLLSSKLPTYLLAAYVHLLILSFLPSLLLHGNMSRKYSKESWSTTIQPTSFTKHGDTLFWILDLLLHHAHVEE